MLLLLLVAALVGYLLGSLPFGYLVARAKGVNIFEVGSRNPGATNVRRCLGKGPGNLVFTLDALKGALATGWAVLALTDSSATVNVDYAFLSVHAVVVGHGWVALGVAGLIGALFGHSFSCFTKFRGGKGVATSVGGLVVLMPLALVIALIVWLATFYSSRYVSLASILAAVSLPVAGFFLHLPPLLFGLTGVIALLVLLRHRANIGRLLNGTENKFARKAPGAPPS